MSARTAVKAGKLALVAAVAGTALVLTACGGGGSSLDRKELIAAGDQLCRASQAEIDRKSTTALSGQPSRKVLIRFIRKEVVPVYRRELKALRALKPDGDSEKAWQQMLDQFEQGVEKIAANPGKVLSQDSSPLEGAARAARDLGMKVCGGQH